MIHRNITVNMLLNTRVDAADGRHKIFEGVSGWNILHPSGLTTYHLKSDLDVELESLDGREYVLLQEVIKNMSINTTRLLRSVWDELTKGIIAHRVYTPNGYIEDVLDTSNLSTHYEITLINNDIGLVTQVYPDVVVTVGSDGYNEYVSMINDLLESQYRFDRQYEASNWYDLRPYGIHNESNLMYDMREHLKNHYPRFNARLVKQPDLSSRLTFNDMILTSEHGGGGVIGLSTVIDTWQCSNSVALKEQLKNKISFIAYLNRVVLIERSLRKVNKEGMSDDK